MTTLLRWMLLLVALLVGGGTPALALDGSGDGEEMPEQGDVFGETDGADAAEPSSGPGVRRPQRLLADRARAPVMEAEPDRVEPARVTPRARVYQRLQRRLLAPRAADTPGAMARIPPGR